MHSTDESSEGEKRKHKTSRDSEEEIAPSKKIKKQLRETNDRLGYLEKEKRRENIAVQGLELNSNSQGELIEEMKNFLNKKLEIETKIKATHRIGPKSYIVKLGSSEEKIEIMKNKRKR
ncbi:hypothetical protein QE152_g1183 [Popillia japonica]|uniref:Uncharacterized protein n=1 Tax=Popillia japonica TaxID=7064 RepID=A0AAW1N9K9_POPJA